MQELYVKNRNEWRNWLAANHAKSSGVWLVFYKKDSDKPSLQYDEAVEEALCYGWIDSIIKKRDDSSYLRKLTPRKPNSRWSALNKQRVNILTRQGRMRKPGLDLVAAAKKTGAWNKPVQSQRSLEIPSELTEALSRNKKAKAFFDQLAPSYQRQYMAWIAAAKRPATKQRRLSESMKLLQRGEKLGMK